MRIGPDPGDKYPMQDNSNLQFIKNTITRPNIIAGDYSYYDARNGESFEERVLYHYPILGDHLIIGKFCQFAPSVTFIRNGANHKVSGFSTFPFNIFGHGWERYTPALEELPLKGDTVVGNDVWLGTEAMILPGIKIGDGAIIAARSVVSKDVEAYTIVGGNPAKPIRKRFSEEIIEELLRVRWWDWNIEAISKHVSSITGGDIEALKKIIKK